jgi:alkanesulfonate monooxygenase SsuD/methylene tetrahydromethanopterin reductase-like flavin-dependent oxidoreductase (luciferase family)
MEIMQIGLGFFVSDVSDTVALIERAERAGVPAVWAAMPVTSYDTPTLFAAALARTERIVVGTAIVPAFTRHPVALLSQAATLEALAPGRLRLGVGTGNLVVTAAALGAPVSQPLARVREYVSILRAGLREGVVRHEGRFYTVDADLPAAPATPVVMAALGPKAFEAAGAVADAAMSWHCPPAYLDEVARPALALGAASAGRDTPPIVQQVTVAVTEDPAAGASAPGPVRGLAGVREHVRRGGTATGRRRQRDRRSARCTGDLRLGGVDHRGAGSPGHRGRGVRHPHSRAGSPGRDGRPPARARHRRGGV